MNGDMTKAETLERYTEGLKQVASCMRELTALHKNKMWSGMANQVDAIRAQGIAMSKSKSLSIADRDAQLEQFKLRMAQKIHGTVQ